jgi:hypothetical protein
MLKDVPAYSEIFYLDTQKVNDQKIRKDADIK